MMHRLSRLALSAAAAGLAITPIAAGANIRAGDGARTYSAAAVSAPGTGRSAQGEGIAGGADVIAFILVGLWATGVVLAFADNGPDIVDDAPDQSPGT